MSASPGTASTTDPTVDIELGALLTQEALGRSIWIGIDVRPPLGLSVGHLFVRPLQR